MTIMAREKERATTAAGSTGADRVVPACRTRILDAAMRVAGRDGILALTLDKVAREAGVSKGGLIHHFRTKHDLISALLERFRAQTLGMLPQRLAADANPRGRLFRALVSMVLEPSAVEGQDRSNPAGEDQSHFFTALLAAAANDPGLLDAFRLEMTGIRQRMLAAGPNGMRQVALWPAIHGLLLWQHLGLLGSDDPLRRAMIAELLRLAEGPGEPAAEPADAA